MPISTDAYRRLYYSNTEALHKTVVTILQNKYLEEVTLSVADLPLSSF